MKIFLAQRRRLSLAWIAAIAATFRFAVAEQLPLKTYTTADGLASDLVRCILSDSRGYLWFGTADGLSRFDGQTFSNVTGVEGLPAADVRCLLEGPDGTYWAATNNGVFHWDPARSKTEARRAAETIHLAAGGSGDDVRALRADPSGGFFAATLDGLYRLEKKGDAWKARRLPLASPQNPLSEAVYALCLDPDGVLWIGTDAGLFRASPGGAVDHICAADGSPHAVRSLLRERQGSLWVGSHAEGIFEIRRGAGKAEGTVRLAFSRRNGLAGDHITSLLETSDGSIWAGSFPGLAEISPDRASVRSYTTAEGLSGIGVWSLAEDRNGNLWLGSDDGGVMRLARDGFQRLDARDGLASTCIDSLFENREGQVCAFTRGTRPDEIAVDRSFVECFDGHRFHAQEPPVAWGVGFGWGTSQVVFQDHRGEWWVPTLGGLYRFPAVAFAQLQASSPRRIYTQADGLPSNNVYRLFEDGSGNIWVGLVGAGATGGLARWERATDSFRVFAREQGIPAEKPAAFAEDRSGAVWIGFESGLARVREGHAANDFFSPSDGLPAGGVQSLYRDHAGRLWIASGAGGVARVDRPEDERPRFVRYSVEQGLSSGSTFSLAEDNWGRIYAGTARGLDRLDPRGGPVQHFTADDGLVHADIQTSLRDPQGNLWFGSPQGLSRLAPDAASQKRLPDIRITRVVADGIVEPLPDLGAREVRLSDLGPGSSAVQIDFLSIDFSPGGRPRYQYSLEGIDRGWTAPTEQRSIVYGRLAAGRYRFRVRAIANDGSIGPTPAEVRFRVLAPLWRRPEVLALFAAALAGLAYLFHRSRLRSALAVERVRTRVATDLHDDVGAGLSEIAILSEMARRQRGTGPPDRMLAEIGESARRLVDAMADIVWSTDPRNDDVSGLTQRIRLFATNALESQGIRWTLEVPPAFEARRLNPESRRQVLLIVQEALTNVARHSGCTHASIRIVPDAHSLIVEIADDGTGFSPPEATSGHGLANMRTRTESLGGEFAVRSLAGEGTVVSARVPLRRL